MTVRLENQRAAINDIRKWFAHARPYFERELAREV